VGSAGEKRKGRKHLPKVQGHSGGLGDSSPWFAGGAYRASHWGLGGSRQSYQWGPVKFLGWVVIALVLMAIAWVAIH
jgi:hypothetical protein